MQLTHDEYVAAFNEAIRLIKGFEGLRLTAYHGEGDHAGLFTIGYGLTFIYGRPVHEGDTITEAEAERLLGIKVGACLQYVAGQVSVNLNFHQLSALTSFEYNEGAGAFHGSTMRTLINQNKLQEAAEQFDRWVYAHPNPKVAIVLPGLLHRREAEQKEFLS